MFLLQTGKGSFCFFLYVVCFFPPAPTPQSASSCKWSCRRLDSCLSYQTETLGGKGLSLCQTGQQDVPGNSNWAQYKRLIQQRHITKLFICVSGGHGVVPDIEEAAIWVCCLEKEWEPGNCRVWGSGRGCKDSLVPLLSVTGQGSFLLPDPGTTSERGQSGARESGRGAQLLTCTDLTEESRARIPGASGSPPILPAEDSNCKPTHY